MEITKKEEKRIIINAPWGRIAGLTWGIQSYPPVFLCHGRMQHSAVFRPLVARLPDTFFYVTIDLPGNGYSDHLPKGVRFTTYDLIPAVVIVQEHFKWDKFAFIGHSLGCSIGKLFNMAYPGRLTCMVELEPTPAYLTVSPPDFAAWFKEAYGDHYTDKGYKKHMSGKETAPTYTYEQAKQMLIRAQDLTEEAAEIHVERFLDSIGDGLYRLTYDQRMKSLFVLPFTPENLRDMYTQTDIPILCILATDSIYKGCYRHVTFIMDESAWPNQNYRFRIVLGNHDVPANDPGSISEYVSKFLLERKCKL